MTKWRIYRMTAEAWNACKTWDDALANNDIETVEEFDTLEEAEKAYKAYNADRYGIDTVREG